MATIAQDSFKLVFAMPLVNATDFFQPISTTLIASGVFTSTIRSGWGASQPSGGAEILLEVEFTVDDGAKTDAQIQALAVQISTITGTPLRQIITNSIARLVPALPAVTVNAPNTVVGTDISGIAVGTANIVLTFGTPYIVTPIVLCSWSSNLCVVQRVVTLNNITFKSNNNQINGKDISYLCS